MKPNIKQIIVIHSLLCLGLWSTLHGETVSSADDSIKYHLDPVVVIATRLPAAQSEVAATISVVGTNIIDHIRLSGTALDAVNNHIPGLFVSQKAVMGYGVAAGAAGGISIRGVGGSPVTGVLVLRDGRPDMMGLMGHPLPDSYGAHGIERIEVIRGPASFLYGTNAMGGVINLVSKRPNREGFQTELSSAIGSYDSRSFGLSHGAKIDRFQYMVTANTARTDGHRPHSDYSGDHFTAHLGLQAANSTHFEVHANYADIDLFDPGPITSPYADHWYDLIRYGADAKMSHDGRFGSTYLQLHGNFGRHRIYDGFRSHDRTVGVLLYHHTNPWQGATLTMGYDWKQYGGEAKNITRPLDYGKHHVNESGAYLHYQQWFLQKWLFSSGVRYETPYDQWLPKAGLVWHIWPRLSWRVSAAKGFRSPTIRELYLFPAPTPTLKPEQMWNYEMGVIYLPNNRLKLEAVVFQSEGKNLIRQLGRWPNITLQNSGEFVHRGFEAISQWHLQDKVQIGASYSWIDSGEETLNTPGQKATLYGQWQWRRLMIYGNVVHVTDLYGADGKRYPLPDYLVIDAAVAYRLGKHIQLRVEGKNLSNQTYQTLYGYPMPKRTVHAQFQIGF